MDIARRIARIVGPVLLALTPTEAFNLPLFAGNPAPVVYLDGVLLFAVGVAIVQAHNRWTLAWPLLVTLTGWGFAAAGLYRMCAPAAPQAEPGLVADAIFAAIMTVGATLTWQGYRRDRALTPTAPSAGP